MTHEKVQCTSHNYIFFLIYTNINPRNTCGNGYKGVSNGGRNIKLNQEDMGPLSRDSGFNVASQGGWRGKGGSDSTFGCLAITWTIGGPQ